jgi:hypothetical protein
MVLPKVSRLGSSDESARLKPGLDIDRRLVV